MVVRLPQDEGVMSNIIIKLSVIAHAAFMDESLGSPDLGGLEVIAYDHKTGNIFVKL